MFDDQEYLDSNKDLIMGVTRSALVCLHSLLKFQQDPRYQHLYQNHLYSTSSNRDLNSADYDHFIVNNLSDILFEDRYATFREELIAELNSNEEVAAAVFNERLDIAKNLPKETKGILTNIVASLRDSKKNFLDWLFTGFIGLEHKYTQIALLELVFNYLSTQPDDVTDGLNLPEEEYFSIATTRENYLLKYLGFNVNQNEELSAEESDKIVKIIQLLNSGILVYQDHNYLWKFKAEFNHNDLELSEIKNILQHINNYPGIDLSEQLSLLFCSSIDSEVTNFKQKYLNMVECAKVVNKLKIC